MTETALATLQQIASGGKVTRAMVRAFEDLAKLAPQQKLEVFHYFSPGIYMRELRIPAGIITTGKIHKYPCLNILAKGSRATLVDGQMEVVNAPHIQLSPAGMKRVSYTLESAVWITVHENPDNCHDVDELEHRLICDTEAEYSAWLQDEIKCLS